jgi:uncharacterized protein (TIGR02284 family)
MPSQVAHEAVQLYALIAATLDSAEGYADAAKAASSSRFTQLFEKRALERRALVPTLQAAVLHRGGTPDEAGTTMGAAKRWFVSLKNLMGGSEASIVSEVEAGEDHVKGIYEAAMQDKLISEPVRLIVTKAYGTIRADHDQMRNLKLDQKPA